MCKIVTWDQWLSVCTHLAISGQLLGDPHKIVKQMYLKCLEFDLLISFHLKTMTIKLDPYIPLQKKMQQIKSSELTL